MLKRFLTALLALAMLLPTPAYAFTIAWMSDTQGYSSTASPLWPQVNRWLVDNREALDIRYVFHTGDIVSASKSDKQWQYAGETMSILSENGIPFLAVTGNHDTGKRASYKRYMDNVGSLQPMHISQEYGETGSRYELFSAEGRDYIFLGLAYSDSGPSEEECEWARQVLSRYPDRTGILLTHSYIRRRGGFTVQGRVIYENIVLPSENLLLVLCGHCRELSRRVDELDTDGDGETDRRVYALLTNFQAARNSGDGYIRMLNFRRDEICACTYSPILNSYEYGNGQTVDIIPLPKLEQ